MLTEKDYCDYDTCVALWSMGLIPHPYDNTDTDKVMAIISLYEAQKWLREEKGIGITIFHHYSHDTYEIFYVVELHNTKHWLKTFGEFTDWTQALSEGIKEAVKILKDGNNN